MAWKPVSSKNSQVASESFDNPQTPLTPTPEPESDSIPVSAPARPIPTIYDVPDKDIPIIETLVSRLTPEQKARIGKAFKKELPELAPSLAGGIVKLPNGAVRVEITLDRDVVEQLTSWAEATNETLYDTIQRFSSDGISAYLASFGQANYTEPPAR